MDADTVQLIGPQLTRFLGQFDRCFGRCTARQHLETHFAGQLGPLERKSVEPMDDDAGVPSRNLQHFLSLFRSDESLMRDTLQQSGS